MKRLVAVALCGLAVGVYGARLNPQFVIADEEPAARADDKPSGEVKSSAFITVKRCRIKLIDQIILASDRPGILDFVEPEAGDMVQAKQQVAGLKDDVDQATFRIAKKQAENDTEIRYSTMAAGLAQIEHEKALEANREIEKTIPDIDVRKLKLAADRAVLQIEQAEFQKEIAGLTRDEAQAKLNSSVVEAPFAGMVTAVFKSKGEAVRQGDPILELSSTRRLRVEGDIEIKDVWTLKRGAYVEVRIDIPDGEHSIENEVFKGRIVFIDIELQVNKKIRVWAEVANHDDILFAGLPAVMKIFPNKMVKPAVVKSDAKTD